MVVDGSGAEVGIVELGSGLVARKFGADMLLLFVTPQGFYQSDIMFFHKSADCSGERFLSNNGGSLAYFGQVSGPTVFYTTLSDRSWTPKTETINSYEIVKLGTDTMVMGECTATAMGPQPVGAAVGVTDPAFGALVAPFRLR
jgi:hypothetical protein